LTLGLEAKEYSHEDKAENDFESSHHINNIEIIDEFNNLLPKNSVFGMINLK